jgi:hydroxymethylpyrimidine pyrophosphatase-like HAD family hydrolase
MVVVVPSVDEVATRGHRVFQGNCMSSVELPPAFSSVHASARAACTRLFFDIDDTLTWQGRLPEVAVAALYRAKAAGLMLCAVTGRSFAWGELMVRLFPFDAVVAETGANALFFTDGGRLTVLHHEDDPVARAALKKQRDVAAAAALAAIPTARLATDNVGRLADTAFDLVEEGEPVPEGDVVALRELLHGHGLVTARSSVHVNAFAFGERGPFDKATMVDRLLRAREGTTLDEAAATLCYVGDSTNDGPLFARAALSVGVANVASHVPALRAAGRAPRSIVSAPGGHGFAQVVDALLEARR